MRRRTPYTNLFLLPHLTKPADTSNMNIGILNDGGGALNQIYRDFPSPSASNCPEKYSKQPETNTVLSSNDPELKINMY